MTGFEVTWTVMVTAEKPAAGEFSGKISAVMRNFGVHHAALAYGECVISNIFGFNHIKLLIKYKVSDGEFHKSKVF